MGNGKRIGAALGRWLLVAIVGVVIVAAVSGGSNWLHQHNGFLRSGSTEDLNQYIAAGRDYPMGEFVNARLKAVIELYATNTKSNETYGAKFQTGVDNYYLVVMEDMTVMTVVVSDQADIEAMENLAKQMQSYTGSTSVFDSATFPSYTVSGKLETLTNQQVIGYYRDAVRFGGFDASGFNVTQIALNASAVRTENVLLYIVLPIAVIVLILVLRGRSRRKKAEEERALLAREAERQAAEKREAERKAAERWEAEKREAERRAAERAKAERREAERRSAYRSGDDGNGFHKPSGF